MCSILFDFLWIKTGMGIEKLCNPFLIFIKLLLIYDIGSDFFFWNSIRYDDNVNVIVRWLVLLFACLGVFIDFIGSCNAFVWSSPESWCEHREKASDNHQTKLHKLSMNISFFEDIPQLILAIIVAFQQKQITTIFILTTLGSGLNILINIIFNFIYLYYQKKANIIIKGQKKKSVIYKCCGFNYLTFYVRLSTLEKALEIENPQYINDEIIDLCC